MLFIFNLIACGTLSRMERITRRLPCAPVVAERVALGRAAHGAGFGSGAGGLYPYMFGYGQILGFLRAASGAGINYFPFALASRKGNDAVAPIVSACCRNGGGNRIAAARAGKHDAACRRAARAAVGSGCFLGSRSSDGVAAALGDQCGAPAGFSRAAPGLPRSFVRLPEASRNGEPVAVPRRDSPRRGRG